MELSKVMESVPELLNQPEQVLQVAEEIKINRHEIAELREQIRP